MTNTEIGKKFNSFYVECTFYAPSQAKINTKANYLHNKHLNFFAVFFLSYLQSSILSTVHRIHISFDFYGAKGIIPVPFNWLTLQRGITCTKSIEWKENPICSLFNVLFIYQPSKPTLKTFSIKSVEHCCVCRESFREPTCIPAYFCNVQSIDFIIWVYYCLLEAWTWTCLESFDENLLFSSTVFIFGPFITSDTNVGWMWRS
jgi:hypothetical protein